MDESDWRGALAGAIYAAGRADNGAGSIAGADSIAGALLAGPLRDLLAERDTLAAQVQAVEGLAEDYAFLAATLHNVPVAETWAEAAADLRRALGTPTTGGGE